MAKVSIGSDFKIHIEQDYKNSPIISIYKNAFFNFGQLPLLLLLSDYEYEENYLQCYFLKEAIDRISAQYQVNLHTTWGKIAIEQIRDNWDEEKNAMTFEDYFQNYMYRSLADLKAFIKPFNQEK